MLSKRRYTKYEFMKTDRFGNAVYEIDQTTGCWNWLLSRDAKGYGNYTDPRSGKRRTAHRVFYEFTKGPVPLGLQLDHVCKNTSCVNPGHLEPVTCIENIHRSSVPRLTKQQVIEIRNMRLAGERGQRRTAKLFGVTCGAISLIESNLTWPDPEYQKLLDVQPAELRARRGRY